MISIAHMVAIGTATAVKTYSKVILPLRAEVETTGSTPERHTPQRAATPEKPRPIGIAVFCRRPESVEQGRSAGTVSREGSRPC
jgi:hypothetical protein